jgi:hypothetical protein
MTDTFPFRLLKRLVDKELLVQRGEKKGAWYERRACILTRGGLFHLSSVF